MGKVTEDWTQRRQAAPWPRHQRRGCFRLRLAATCWQPYQRDQAATTLACPQAVDPQGRGETNLSG